jgi:hypothetical protein
MDCYDCKKELDDIVYTGFQVKVKKVVFAEIAIPLCYSCYAYRDFQENMNQGRRKNRAL